ncbi:epithelial discoidin domain-containing receptor 1-like [Homarus americanus]|nr:epithelial discoidin domain-containing receptor 1-like [Homarus americanus]
MTVEEEPSPVETLREGQTFESRSPLVPTDDSPSGLLVGGLVTLGVVFGVVPVVLCILYYRTRLPLRTEKPEAPVNVAENRKVSMKMKDLHINLNLASVSNGYSRANGKLYGHVAMDDEAGSSLYQEPYKTQLTSSQYSLSKSGGFSDTIIKNPFPPDTDDSVDYAVPNINMTPPPPFSEAYTHPLTPPFNQRVSQSSLQDQAPSCPPILPIPPIPPPPEEHYFRASQLCQASSIQGVTGTVIYNESEVSDANYERPVPELARHRLHPLEVLGGGAYGVVQLCRVDDVDRKGSRMTLMKQLHPGTKEVLKKEFHQEARSLSHIEDPNVARLVGMVTRTEPLCMLVEYLPQGDLCQFLRRHLPENSILEGVELDRPLISYGGLIYIATQVASGMRHLETIKLVHRDLATRNCLVGSGLSIKISDFAMSRPLYSSDYYRLSEGRALLPIRWMAWESILQGRFSTKSDAWAFGVTLWEILTMARQQPYDELSDDGVLENVSHCYHGDGSGMMVLPHPPLCPREMYDMMTACWRPNDRQRPPFWEIHLFLQRKNLGYALDYKE